eukprot:CAMPEP_0114671892 /NCGR_PEP_ID=MMETSP0191-20121206/41946_1 /TAXON_ID=126664 /ORGANISM="Sorites sp." /LENGTH=414 /DNA_ID=CAMNT_0001932857 /DNA_START=1601 /DNA_END=2845 /DNA_ORIENTATION=-
MSEQNSQKLKDTFNRLDKLNALFGDIKDRFNQVNNDIANLALNTDNGCNIIDEAINIMDENENNTNNETKNEEINENNTEINTEINTINSQMNKIKEIAKYIKSDECKNIGILSGAGISVSSGIKDWRSKGGSFDSLDVNNPKLKLTYDQKKRVLWNKEYISDIELFEENPVPLLYRTKTFYETDYKPSVTHWFQKLLYDKGKLRRIYTQNIDGLDQKTGLTNDVILNVHGSLSSFKCIKCDTIFDKKDDVNGYIRQMINEEYPLYCNDDTCNNYSKKKDYVKPNVVLFGESLPERFNTLCGKNGELGDLDLLIIIGTSLKVYPIAGIVNKVSKKCKRLVMNMHGLDLGNDNGSYYGGYYNTSNYCYDDTQIIGKCDDITIALCQELGWINELNKLRNIRNNVDNMDDNKMNDE